MNDVERDFVRRAVDIALGGVRVDDPSAWLAKCPPPCAQHSLLDVLTNHEDGPIYVFQSRVEHPDSPTTGLVVGGRSTLVAGSEQDPIATRLNPTLQSITFTAILSPEIVSTHAEVIHNTPAHSSRVTIPLINDGSRLNADVATLTPDQIGLATIYLL
jgi:hypothetical protein